MKRSIVVLGMLAMFSFLYCQEASNDENNVLGAILTLERQLDTDQNRPAISLIKKGQQEYTEVCQNYFLSLAERPGSGAYYDVVNGKIIVLSDNGELLLIIVMTGPMFAKWVAASNEVAEDH
jgi:hypothetical protein